MEYYEKPIQKETVYNGLIVNVRSDIAALQTGKHVRREVVEHPGGVAVVPVAEDGSVLMVRQYRYPMEEELLEIPAGKLEPGEAPLECAIRELSEETGCTPGEMISLGATYPSPGFCEEVLHIFLARDLQYGEMHLDEDEFLSVERVPMDVLVEMVMTNRIPDAKTIVGLFKAREFLGGVHE